MLQKLNGEAEVSCVEEQLRLKQNAFAAIRKENMEYEQNVEDYRIKISERCNVKAKQRRNMHLLYSVLDPMWVCHDFIVWFLLVRKQ